MNETKLKENVPLSSRLWLGGADCMITTLNNILTGGGLTYFFVTYCGLSPAWSATCWLIFGIWNAVNDPLFGFISDHTKSKLGRRIPYIRYGSVMIAAIFILTWVEWFNTGSQGQMFAQMLVSLFLFDTLYTAIATSIYVMPFEMAITNEARGKILLVKVIFGLVALSVPLVLLAEIKNILAQSLQQFQLLMTIIGLVAGAIIFCSSFFYHEKEYIQQEEQYPLWKSIVTCFKNRSFLVFEALSFSIILIQTALMMGLSFYFDAEGVSYLWCYLAMFAGILIGMYLWMKPLAGWGVKRETVFMCGVFGGGLLIMMLLGHYTAAGVIGFFCSGIGFSGGMFLIPMMNGDVIDYDEHVSGLRREGMYAGVNSFITKPAISLANAAFPAMLLWFGYDKNIALAAQTATAKFGIRFSWLFCSVLALAICFVIIKKFYPLDGEEWNKTKAELAAEHEKKQRAYEEEILKRQS